MSNLKRYDIQAEWLGGSQVELDIEECIDGEWIKGEDFNKHENNAVGWRNVKEEQPDPSLGKIWAYGEGYCFECEWDNGYWCNIGGDDFTYWMPAIHPEPNNQP